MHTIGRLSADISEQMQAHYQPDFRRHLGTDLQTLSAQFQEISWSRSTHFIDPISGDMSEQMQAHCQPDFRRHLGTDLHTLSAQFQAISWSRSMHIIGRLSADISEQMQAHFQPDFRRYLGADIHCLTLRPIFTLLPPLWGGSSRAARFARGAAAATPQGARGKPLLEGDASVR